jgi:hypothetical protein
MADAITVLREEIVTLEREVSKRRQALTLLTGAATPAKNPAQKSPAVKRPTAKRLAPKRPAAKRPAPRLSTPATPTLAARIVSYLSAHKGKLLTAAQVTEELVKTDKRVKRDNVQRRFSDLCKQKKVKREDGRYSVV